VAAEGGGPDGQKEEDPTGEESLVNGSHMSAPTI
jgi:hypothetical protein